MAEGARLESVFTGNRNVGSNPTPSANLPKGPVILPHASPKNTLNLASRDETSLYVAVARSRSIHSLAVFFL